jgi:hypothetical protein
VARLPAATSRVRNDIAELRLEAEVKERLVGDGDKIETKIRRFQTFLRIGSKK